MVILFMTREFKASLKKKKIGYIPVMENVRIITIFTTMPYKFT
jgi:hypothetical protein